MIVTIDKGEIRFTVDAFLASLSHDDRMYLARQALHDKEVLKNIVNEIISGPPKPCYYEARMLLLDNLSVVHKRFVHGLLTMIEVLNRRLKASNDRGLKLWYDWPKDRIGERPKVVLYDKEIPIPDADLEKIIKSYFEARKNDENST
jgi:hypothetical protein